MYLRAIIFIVALYLSTEWLEAVIIESVAKEEKRAAYIIGVAACITWGIFYLMHQ